MNFRPPVLLAFYPCHVGLLLWKTIWMRHSSQVACHVLRMRWPRGSNSILPTTRAGFSLRKRFMPAPGAAAKLQCVTGFEIEKRKLARQDLHTTELLAPRCVRKPVSA